MATAWQMVSSVAGEANSTPMEPVSRLTDTVSTPGRAETTFSTRAEQAAQLMPVTRKRSMDIPPFVHSVLQR